MLINKYLKSFLLILTCLLCIFLVSKELFNFDRVYTFEMYGFSHLDNNFQNVCDFENKFKTFGMSDNVTPSREDSLFYTLPSKIFYEYASPFKIHRIVHLLAYSIFTLSLCLLVFLLTKNFLITFLTISFSSLSSQFLSYVFEYKLAITSLTLTSFLFLIVFLFEEATKENKKIATLYAIILPFLFINFGFEVYCISRPVNIAMWGVIFLFLLIKYKKLFASYTISSIFSIMLLKYCKPDLKLDLRIFTARGESFIKIQGEHAHFFDFNELFQNLLERIKEIRFLFRTPLNEIYISEMPANSGFLDVIIVASVLFIVALLLIKLSKDKKYFYTFNQNKLFTMFVTLFLIFSFVTPFFSTTYLRGHRFVNFYFSLIVLTVILLKIVLTKVLENSPKTINSLLLLISLGIFIYKLNIFTHYNFDINKDFATNCLNSIEKLANETKDIKTVNKITLCDNGTSPIFYPTFKGILYLSGIACKRTNIHNQIIHLKKSEKQECVCDNKNGNICLTREDPCEIKLHTPEN